MLLKVLKKKKKKSPMKKCHIREETSNYRFSAGYKDKMEVTFQLERKLMVHALERKQATENLPSGWLFESGVPNPQLTG